MTKEERAPRNDKEKKASRNDEKRRYGMTEVYSSSHAFERSEIKASNYRDPLTFCFAKRGMTE